MANQQNAEICKQILTVSTKVLVTGVGKNPGGARDFRLPRLPENPDRLPDEFENRNLEIQKNWLKFGIFLVKIR